MSARNAQAGPGFAEASSKLEARAWGVLGGLAAEERLGRATMAELGCDDALLDTLLTRGLVRRAGTLRPLSLARGLQPEAAYEVTPIWVQLVLRRAQKEGALGPATLRTEELLGPQSRAGTIRQLQAGTLVFRTAAKSPLDPQLVSALCRSVLCPFDPGWLLATWKKRTPRILSLVLDRCLKELLPCEPLYDWLLEDVELSREPEIAPLLIALGLHRLESERVSTLLLDLDLPCRSGLLAAAQFLQGKTSAAEHLLDLDRSAHAPRIVPTHPFTPLLALLRNAQLERSNASEASLAKWLNQKGADSSAQAVRRAWNTFLRYQREPERRLLRLDAHQIKSDAPAWEVLILGLSVHTFVDAATTRAAWAQRLTRLGATALARSYLWMGRQALVLAAGLDQAQLRSTLDEEFADQALPISETGLAPQAGDIAALSPRRADWEIRLSALQKVGEITAPPATKHRVRWFVDADSGRVGRPGLLSHEPRRGWFLERRISFSEAENLAADFPDEDRRVLGRTDRAIEDPDFPHLEIFRALIGHPRVVDGARAGLPIEVVSESCRIETQESTETLSIFVRPRGVGPGLNLLRAGDTRLAVVEVDETMTAVLEALPQDLVVPQAEAQRALAVLETLGPNVPVVTPLLEGSGEEAASSTPVVRFTPHAGAYLVEIGVQPFGADGRFFLPGVGPSALMAQRGGRKVRLNREFGAESARCSRLLLACPLLLAEEHRGETESGCAFVLGHEQVLELLQQLPRADSSCTLSWSDRNPIRFAGSLGLGALRGALRQRKAWYLLSGSIALDEVTSLTLSQLTRVPFVHGGRYIRLPSGDYAAVDRRVRQLAALLATVDADGTGTLRLDDARLLSVNEALDGASVEIDQGVRERLSQVAEGLGRTPRVPSAFRGTLRPYQLEGFAWLLRMASLGFGVCLADDMGLGKTIQVIAFLLTRPPGKRHLVVAPLSVCNNWAREIEHFAPTLSVRRWSESRAPSSLGRSSEVVVASYGQLVGAVERLEAIEWDTAIADEAQFVKNPKTQRARALLSLRAQHRIAATGTPIENHLGDLYGVFRFLQPKLLGSWNAFQAHFVKPIERDGEAAAREGLHAIVRPFLLRRTKEQVLPHLPPRTHVRHEVPFNDEEAQRYAFLRREIQGRLESRHIKRNKLEILAQITRLRRFCCHPRLVFPEAPDESPKLRALVPLLEELIENGHRALVFSQYVDFLTSVRERLSEHGLVYEYLDGSTPEAERQKSIDRFAEGRAPVFLLSLKAGGTGLNLTAADYVIHLDPWWNPAVSAQATSRAHRIGQDKPVMVYELVVPDSIEEDILGLHAHKDRLAEQLLHEADEVGRLPAEDLEGWLLGALSKLRASGL